MDAPMCPPGSPDPGPRPAPSDWVTRWAAQWPAGCRVLDLACGSGRHLRWLAGQGFDVTGVDRDSQALAGLTGLGELVQADVEQDPWPLEGRTFDAVVVTNYLWRPLLPHLLASVAPGGWWVIETFAHGQASVGRPARPDFLLQPGELPRWLPAEGWRLVAFEDGWLEGPGRYVQRMAAVREPVPASTLAAPPRYPLDTRR